MTQNNTLAEIPGLAQQAAHNSMLRSLLEGESIQLDDSFTFACHGCGMRCCVNQDILVSPPEALRLAWAVIADAKLLAHLRRVRRPWLEVFDGGSTGLPVAMINFWPVDDETRVCPFLMRERRNGSLTERGLCAAREGRPGACRIYPLGRMFVGDQDAPGRGSDDLINTLGQADAWQWRLVSRCAGFEPAASPTAPGYRAAPPGQTARDWLAGQMDAQVELEKNFYVQRVVPAFMAAGLHRPTDDSPGGRLQSGRAFGVLADVFYSLNPRCLVSPRDPAEAHEMVMRFLNGLIKLVEPLRRVADEAARAGGSATVLLPVLPAPVARRQEGLIDA